MLVTPMAATVLTDIAELATCPAEASAGEIGLIRDAALAWEDGRVVWTGPEADLPERFSEAPRESAGGRLVIPGLVDCHTHLVHAGDRADEFVERLRGTSYLDIAKRGGGILSTVRATRAASESELQALGRERLGRMLVRGVTTVEAKSGYGLSVEDELKQLRVARRLGEAGPQRLVSTCLAAHTVPPEYAGDRSGYLRLITEEVLPRVAEADLARFVDVFVEEGAFTPDEARTLFEAAAALGFSPKLHADQLSDTGGAVLAAEVEAASADHLEYISEAGIEALATSGTVAVSLPLATLVLGEEPLPARRLLDAGARVAVATDFNPGSAPVCDLPLALWLACTRQRMTPAEALQGATAHAARALRLSDVGSLTPGAHADVVVIDAPGMDQWMTDFRPDAVRRVVIGGETVWVTPR